MPTLIVSVDPGDNSGLAYYCPEDGLFACEEGPAVDILDRVEDILASCEVGTKLILVVEGHTFTYQVKLPHREIGQIESIGACMYLAHKYGAKFEAHAPGDRKIVTKDALRKLDWLFPSADNHMIDATQHLVLECLRRGFIRPEQLR